MKPITTECHIYGKSFYSYVSIGSVRVLAHRLAWALHNGADPGKLKIVPTCGNGQCIRGDHLGAHDTSNRKILDAWDSTKRRA